MHLLKQLRVGALFIIIGSSFSNAAPRIIKESREDKTNTQIIAGVTVPDTPLVRSAQSYARAHADDMSYNHIMRSWLFGAIIIQRSESRSVIDPEVHAVAALLHDLGWDNTNELVSNDKRFEVDGAIAAWNFIEASVLNGTAHSRKWDDNQKQLLWDTIALHTTPSIFAYKQPVVFLTAAGINADFLGPDSDLSGLLTWNDYYQVKAAFPRLDLASGVTKIICGFAANKPATTYDNFMKEFGVKYIQNYSENAVGKLGIDMVENALPN
ncbi:hypothetical protein B0O99DRAFT_556103 [Bisporella sp. PMI_857]|nr:hypothetical protein B0O99DRAFT_556103 [Bisporella sp. PMI_857]